MSTEPRIPVAGGVAGVRGALGHLDGISDGLTALQAAVWDPDASRVEPRIKEIARLRNARVTDCAF
jgi:hypothetical protein